MAAGALQELVNSFSLTKQCIRMVKCITDRRKRKSKQDMEGSSPDSTRDQLPDHPHPSPIITHGPGSRVRHSLGEIRPTLLINNLAPMVCLRYVDITSRQLFNQITFQFQCAKTLVLASCCQNVPGLFTLS